MSIQRRATTESLRPVRTPRGLPDSPAPILSEFDGYVKILLGDAEPPPNDFGDMLLMELANLYHSRALEVQALIYRGERDDSIPKNSHWYKFRTGELESFLTIFKRAEDLGSRRLTYLQSRGRL